MSLRSLLESLLFVSSRPLTRARLSELADTSVKEVDSALQELSERYREQGAGVQLTESGGHWQFTTVGENAKIVQEFLRDEMTGELTRPSLETLTIIAYRGPVIKPEIEQIRGVNCSLILRNLLIRGLIEAEEDKKTKTTAYRVTLDFLRFLGVRRVEELPDYEKLRADKSLTDLLLQARVADSAAVNNP